MIVEWLISVGSGIGTWVASLFPELDIPSGIVNLDDNLSALIAMGAGLGVWVDWTYIGFVAAIPLVIFTGGLLIKALRSLIAHLPFIGGKG